MLKDLQAKLPPLVFAGLRPMGTSPEVLPLPHQAPDFHQKDGGAQSHPIALLWHTGGLL